MLIIQREIKRFQKAKKRAAEVKKTNDEQEKEKEKEVVEVEDEQKEKQIKRKYNVGEIFGDLSIFKQKKWRHVNIFALEESAVLVFSTAYILKIIKVNK